MRNAPKIAAGILIILTAAFWAFSISALGEDKYPACQAVSEKSDYGSGLAISESTKALIESYREDWKILCDSKGGRKPSLANILVKAKQIEADFKKVFDSFDESIINEPAFDPRRAIAINDLVSNKLPQFVPAFKGAYGEHEMFSPSIDAFRKHAPLGTSEDRTFLESQIPLEGDFPPYITKTWDYGGCDQFGEYDWTGALKRIDRVKRQVKSAVYLGETSKFEDGLAREFTTNFDICTCKAKDAVLKDLFDIQKYVKKEPGYGAYVPKIQQTIDSIHSGKISIKSEMEQHCSGG
jgi:hypothetical protein